MEIKINKFDQELLEAAIKRLRDQYPDSAIHEFNRFGDDVVEEMKTNAPYRTGHLRDNISRKKIRQGRGGGVEIKSDAGYSGFVEYGTRHFHERPFFFKAIQQNIDSLIRNL